MKKIILIIITLCLITFINHAQNTIVNYSVTPPGAGKGSAGLYQNDNVVGQTLAGVVLNSTYSNFFGFLFDDEITDLPVVLTLAVSDKTTSSVVSGGEITSDGGFEVIARGVCWNTTGSPTITDYHTSDGTGMGTFTSNLTGLNPGTHYFVRAYATNSIGTAYGNEIEFATGYTLWSWGLNWHGGIGHGTTSDVFLSPQQLDATTDWATVSCGNYHTLAIKSDGTLWAWGQNNHGQLGDGTTIERLSPVQIGDDNQWVSLSASMFNSAAIKQDGTIWTWGWNLCGQIGNGITDDQLTPNKVNDETDWASISCGNAHMLALKTNGQLWGWGWNQYGELGIEGTSGELLPRQIGTDWAFISAGGQFSIAIKTNGTLWAWGYNNYGQLGYVTPNVRQYIPQQIDNATDWAYICSGMYHAVAIKTNGSLWAWGYNGQGRLGDGTTTDRNTPVPIGSSNNWASLSCDENTMALKTDGTIWIWGQNGYGQIGGGLTDIQLTPVQIGPDNTWSVISAGSYHFAGLKNSSTPVLPTITTTLISAITNNSAQSGGNITSDGGSPVTERGVCWNTTGNPTIADNHTSDGIGLGIFTSNLSGLNPGTHYYVRAYATNSAGTAYGNELEFTTSSPKIIYVKYDATGSNNGTSWTNAFTSFQSALDVAVSGKQIWAARGTYYPSSDYSLNIGERGKHFRMINDVTIYGGFEGIEPEDYDLSQRNFETNEAILSGDLGTAGDNSDNCCHVFFHPEGLGLTSSAILDGFTISGGNANLTSNLLYSGGGMANYSNSPSLTNCNFSSNSAMDGGGMYNRDQCNPIITNCIFTSNAAVYDGGGMFNNISSPSLTNCTFTNNSTNISGGGIFNYSSSPSLTNCTFTNNSATNSGGGMYNYLCNPIINNSIIWGNTAANGKQISNSSSSTALNNSCFANGTNDVIGTITTSNCINSNPKFVGTGSYPYSLLGYSPCINAGNNSYNSTETDIRGQARIQDGTIDMGAYENQFMPDNIPPVAICKNKEVTLVNGSATINASDIDNGSYDNDEIASMTVSQSVFTCSDIGENTVTLTVTDVSGNSSTCNATVTVIGTIPSVSIAVSPSPTIDPGGDANTIYLGYGPQSVTLTASGGVSYEWSSNPVGFISTSPNPTVSPTVTTDYTVIATNQYGCSASHTVTIYVENVQSGNNDNQILICVKGKTKRVAANAVSAQLKNGAYLGECKGSAKSSEEIFDDNEMNSYQEEEVAVKLKQNYPNPFAALTEIQYFVSKKEHATLVLTDLGGRVVANLVDRYVNGGWNTLIVNGSGLTAGAYFLRLESMGKDAIMKIVKAD